MDERQRYEQGMKLRRARSEFGNSRCAGSIRAARQMIPPAADRSSAYFHFSSPSTMVT